MVLESDWLARTFVFLTNERVSRLEGNAFPVKEQGYPSLMFAARFPRGLELPPAFLATPHFVPMFSEESNSTAKQTRILANADHAALPGSLVRKSQLPSYLVCSDKEQNLTEMRREPQLAKPRDFHSSRTPMCGFSSPLRFSLTY